MCKGNAHWEVRWGRDLIYMFTEDRKVEFLRWMWRRGGALIISYSPIWWGKDSCPRLLGTNEQTTQTPERRDQPTAVYSSQMLMTQGRGHRSPRTARQGLHQGLWEAVTRGRGPWFQWEDVLGLLEYSCCWQGAETCYSEISRNCTWAIW